MSTEALIEALTLPPDTRVDQRVPKKLLLEQGAPTPADKRHIQDGVEEVFWVAVLKPTNIGVPAYRDDTREYIEISVLTAGLRPQAKAGRLTELIHRAIPYPLVLVAEQGGATTLSLAHKRFSEAERGHVIAETLVQTTLLSAEAPSREETAFLASLNLAAQPRRDLFALYEGWCDRVAALDAARFTGSFVLRGAPEQAAQRRIALEEHARVQRAITQLRKQAATERQLNRRVELNLELKRFEATLAELTKTL